MDDLTRVLHELCEAVKTEDDIQVVLTHLESDCRKKGFIEAAGWLKYILDELSLTVTTTSLGVRRRMTRLETAEPGHL